VNAPEKMLKVVMATSTEKKTLINDRRRRMTPIKLGCGHL
jgi:hypothetical protein